MPIQTIQTRRWTRQEYERMAETGIIGPDERIELLDGDIIPMTPQNSPHAVAVGKTENALRKAFPTEHWVRVQMPLILGPHSEPDPDLAVVKGTFDDYLPEHPRAALLVVEISDTTLSRDRDRKLPLYAQAGIPEYWIVNLVDHCLEVYRDPALSQGEQPAQYRTAFNLGAKNSVSPSTHSEHTITISDLLP